MAWQIHLRRLSWLLCLATSFSPVDRVACGQPPAVDLPRWLGPQSCGTATCHGGVMNVGPAWHWSAGVWETQDPHARAGELLLGTRSQRMVWLIEPATRLSDVAFQRVLIERCAGCHAPAACGNRSGSSVSPGVDRSLESRIVEGVSCEACHGPASQWRDQHTNLQWAGADRFQPMSGMLNTESAVERTAICASCHVGSRSKDGPLRDMDHDMIAAGHPPLQFNMHESHQRLPAHWDKRSAVALRNDSELRDKRETIRLLVLDVALRLSADRQANHADGQFIPELSEFDCQACHHALQFRELGSGLVDRRSARWQPWYTSDTPLENQTMQLRLDSTDLAGRLKQLYQGAGLQTKRGGP